MAVALLKFQLLKTVLISKGIILESGITWNVLVLIILYVETPKTG